MMMRLLFICLIFGFSILNATTQESDLTGIEFSIDQDHFVDFIHDDPVADDNYTIALRLGFYGAAADMDILGLPWVRKKVDGLLIDRFLYNYGFNEESVSHNFVFTANGFSPYHISDETEGFVDAVANGYRLANDRPFSSFTGFRSSRRIQGSKRFAHSAQELDIAINSSFTFGFANFGLAHTLDNLFGAGRPSGNLWNRDDTEPYPTGQVAQAGIPLFMYSVSVETVVWKPIKKVLLQLRPEFNLGYYTNVGFGIDFGKVMNVDRHIDNLSYTDTHNPGLISVNNDVLGFSLVGGMTGRLVLFNSHLNGWFSSRAEDYESLSNKRFVLAEAYLGCKLQFFKKIELNFSINGRTAEFGTPASRTHYWGTFGMKYLIEEEGEGCYDN